MTFNKSEKQYLQLAAAAFLLGLFALNPTAKAADLVATVGKEAFSPAPAMEPTRFVRTETIRPEVQADRSPALAAMDEGSERDGLSLQELNRILREPLQVRANEKKTDLAFLGDVPSRCVYNDKGEMTASIDYDREASNKETHVFRIRLPLCSTAAQLKKKPGDEKNMVKLSSLPGARAMNDVKGKVVLASGFKDSDTPPKFEELKEKGGEAVVLETEAVQLAAERAAEKARQEDNQAKALAEEQKRQKEEQELAAKKQKDEEILAAKKEKARLDQIAKRLDESCKAGDAEGIEQAAGNLPELKDEVLAATKWQLKANIEKAASADEAKIAWESYEDAGSRLSWEEEHLTKGKAAYIKRRFSMIDDLVERVKNDEAKPAELDQELSDWASELSSLDSREYKKRKGEFAKSYGFLAANVSDVLKKKNNRDVAKSVAEAEKYYGKAKKYADGADRTRADGAMAKLNGEAFKACVRNSPFSMADCESKYRERVKEHGERYVDALGKRAQNGDDEAAADVAAFARDYLQAEGYGATYNFSDFGTLHQVPGYFEQYKMQTMQQAQQQMMQQYQQQMMSQMYGGMGMGMGMGFGGGFGAGVGMQRASFFGF